MAKILKFPTRRQTVSEAGSSGATDHPKGSQAGPWSESGADGNVIPLASGDENTVPDFQTFHQKILQGDLVSAGELLSFLLGVTHFQGIECARVYRHLNHSTQDAGEKVADLLNHLNEEKNNECLMLLSHCFGLGGAKAVVVLQHLKSQI